MRKKIANQISVPVIAATVIAILIITFFSYVIINQVTQRQLEINISNAHRTYSKTLEVLTERTLQFAAILPDNEMVKQAYRSYYQSNDIETSVEILKQEFRSVNMFVSQTEFSNLRIHYHTNRVHSFYRSWTTKRGDDISWFRETIKKCQNGKKPVKGIEAGRGGLAIRGIVPILDTDGSVLGSVENYVKMNEIIKRMIVDSTQENFALIIKPEITELFDSIASDDISPKSRFIDGFLLHSVTSGLFDINEFNKSVFEKALLKKLSFKTKNYVNSLEPITDFEGKTIGLVVYQYNLFDYNRQLSELRYLFIGVGLTLIFFIFVIIKSLSIKIVGKPINKIKSFIQRISKGDLETDEQVCCDNEIGDVFEKLRQMSKILKENREILVNKNAELLTAEEEIRASNEQLMVINETLNEKMAQLKESADFNQSILKTIPFGMHIVDQTGKILFQSQLLKNLIGHSSVGRNCWSVYPDQRKIPHYCPLKQEVKIGETSICEANHVFNNRIYEIHYTGMIYKGQQALLEVFQDITEKVKDKEDILLKHAQLQIIEEELRILNEELHQANISLQQQMDELTLAKNKAEEADQLKTAFLQNISHEIRTPLNAIVGFSEILINIDTNDPQRENYQEIILQASTQLTNVITDLVNIATIETGQYRVIVEEVALHVLLLELENLFKEKVKGKDIQLNFSFPTFGETLILKTDKTKLKQIFINLIGNALKFTPRGFVRITYEIIEKQILFKVQDSGIGIPPKYQSKIFERFSQGAFTNNRIFGGNGLGLSISKAYVELLKGTIGIESKENEGSTFFFQLPIEYLVK